MTAKQISILLENQPGSLSSVSDLLGKEGINICSLSLSENTDRAIVRLITDNPGKTLDILKNSGFHAWEVEVIAVVTPDHPGGLNAVLKPLSLAGINVNYLYSVMRRYEDHAVIIFRVDDNEKAITTLKENYMQLLGEELYAL